MSEAASVLGRLGTAVRPGTVVRRARRRAGHGAGGNRVGNACTFPWPQRSGEGIPIAPP